MPIFAYLCSSGHSTEEVVLHHEEKPRSIQCGTEDCHESATPILSWMGVATRGRHIGTHEQYTQGPVYIEALDAHVTSEKHRVEVAARQGVRPVSVEEASAAVDRAVRARSVMDRKTANDYAAYYDKVENAPAFRDYRKARDQDRAPTLPEPSPID